MASSSKKSTTIVNQYQYTDPLMVEVQDGYAAQTYKNYITLIIIALICAFFTWREYNTHKGVLCILFAIIVVLCESLLLCRWSAQIREKKLKSRLSATVIQKTAMIS